MAKPYIHEISSTFFLGEGIVQLTKFPTLLLLLCSAIFDTQIVMAEADPTETELPSASTPEEAAKIGMLALPELVNSKTAQLLGFEAASDATISQVDLKSPWAVYEINLDRRTDTKEPFRKTNMRIFPITVRGKTVSSLTVTFSEKTGSWKTAEWGSTGRIRKLTKHKRTGSSFVVWVPKFNLYFVGNREGNRLLLTPIRDMPKLKFSEGVPLEVEKVIRALSSVSGLKSEVVRPREPG